MTFRSVFTKGLVLATTVAFAILPMTANADGWRHRSAQKDQWKDLAIASGIIGILGAASHNDTVAALGAGGALYSAYRYEEECDSDGRWFHWNGGHRVYDRDYRPSRDRDDWNRGRDWDRGDSGRGRDRDRRENRDRRDTRRDDRSSSRDRDHRHF